ncbi:MAG: hypothetical protein R6W71_00210 [Bacteroidales bacterium]
MYQKILLSGVMLLSIPWLAAQNVGIGTSTPAAKLDVQGNKISYDVLNVSNDKDGTPDSLMVFSSDGNLGIGVPVPGPYKLVTHGLFPTAFSPQVEFWNGDPNLSPSVKLADINAAGGSNGVLNLYSLGSQNATLRALGNSYLMGGNLGIGTTIPRESLELTGAAIFGPYSQPAGGEIAGTIEWNGANFVGWTGPGQAVLLDVQSQVFTDNDWAIIPSGYIPPVGTPPANPELVPMTSQSSLSMSFQGDPNQGGIVWIPDRTLPGIYPHQLMLESTSNGINDASMLYRMSDWSNFPVPPVTLFDYSEGIHIDASFKVCNTNTLTPTWQGDATTMFRTNQMGIVDIPNQSRSRATVINIDWGSWQLIQPNFWTPVNFTNPITIPTPPYPPGFPWFDEQNEFTVTANPNDPIAIDSQGNPVPNSFFTATMEGYYQVNARCEFETDEYQEPDPGGGGPIIQSVYMRPNAYVAVAIYYEFQGTWISYAIGNNLATTNNVLRQPINPQYEDATETMYNNNAPNVSDIVYLQPGDRIAIYVFHWAYTPMMLRAGDDVMYVSIHKIS